MLSYGRLTVDFGIVVFAKTRWLFSYGVTFLPELHYPKYPLLYRMLLFNYFLWNNKDLVPKLRFCQSDVLPQLKYVHSIPNFDIGHKTGLS